MTTFKPVLWGRSLLFYVGYVTSTALWGTSLTLIALFLPKRMRFGAVIPPWVGFVLWWLKITCNIKVELEGTAYLKQNTGILFMKHMSSWDALYSQLLVRPQTTIIKRKLLWIPCFGWAFWVTNPISIDREQRMSALRHIVDEGAKRLANGTWVTLFPEGTRVAPGSVGRFQRGGAMLANRSRAPVYIVAHNGGRFWRHGTFLKYPGVIKVRISPPFTIGDQTSQEFNEMAEAWMREQMLELDPPPSTPR